MGRTFKALATMVIVVALAAPTSVGAAGIQTDPRILLNDAAALDAYLFEQGIDPGAVTIQRGARNYAGPNCPGAEWSCVAIVGPIVQLNTQAAGGQSTFQCSGTSTGPNECTVIQVSAGSPNNATCTLGTPTAPVTTNPVTQSCTIDQHNSGNGSNTASVTQAVFQNRSATSPITQTVRQNASVKQNGQNGANNATILQRSEQKAETKNFTGSVTHTQEASKSVLLDQDSTGGNQTADVDQIHIQRQEAKFNVNGPITMSQDDADDGVDVLATMTQHSSTGVNTTTLDQITTQDQESKSNNDGPITLKQGSPSGGQKGDLNGDSSPSTSGFTVKQVKSLKQEGLTAGAKSLSQEDPELCCIFGDSFTYDTCSIDQSTTLNQNPLQTQTVFQRGRAISRDNCGLVQTSTTNQGSQTRTASGTFFDVTTNRCNSGCPDSTLDKKVRNETTGGSFGSSANAVPGNIIEFGLDYKNEGNATATGVTVSDAVPDRSTFLSCSDGCTGASNGSGPGTPVNWSLGSIPAGGTKSVSFRVQLNATFPRGTTTIVNIASTDSVEEDPHDSTRVTVTVTAQPSSSLSKQVRKAGGTYGSSASAVPGDLIDFRLQVTNNGGAAATGVVVNDAVTPRSTFVSCSPACGATSGGPGTPLTWSVGTVQPAQTVSVTFRVQLDATFPGGTTVISNTGDGSADGEAPFTSNTVTVSVTAAPVSSLNKAVRNVSLGGSFDDADPDKTDAIAGNRIQYRLRARNTGNANATGVIVSDTIRNHMTFVSCTNGCTTTGSSPGSTIEWNLGTIAPGAEVTVFFTVDLAVAGYTQIPTIIPNIATVDSAEENPVSSNEARVTVTCAGVLC